MKTTKNLALVIGLMAIGGFGAPALAADAPAPSSALTFGIVDMNKIMRTTNVAKDVLTQLEGRRKEYQEQISKEGDELRSAEQGIEKQKDSLSKIEFDRKRSSVEEKVTNAQKLVDVRKHILDQAFNTSMEQLRREAASTVASIAKERNYSAVFTQDAVMISLPSLDMTDVVIEQMNKNVKKITIDWKAEEAAAKVETGGNASPNGSTQK